MLQLLQILIPGTGAENSAAGRRCEADCNENQNCPVECDDALLTGLSHIHHYRCLQALGRIVRAQGEGAERQGDRIADRILDADLFHLAPGRGAGRLAGGDVDEGGIGSLLHLTALA